MSRLTVERGPGLRDRVASRKEEGEVAFGKVPERYLAFGALSVFSALLLPFPNGGPCLRDCFQEMIVVEFPENFKGDGRL